MTVSSTTAKDTAAGNGSNDTFAYTFSILDETHILVRIKDTNGVFTTKVLTTDYTITGTGNTSGSTDYTSGNVVFGAGDIPASTDTVVLTRAVPLLQGTDYTENDSFPAESHEDALDELTMIAQQIDEEVDRSVKFDAAVTSTIGEIDTPTADAYLKRTSANTGWEWSTLSATSGLGNIVEDLTPQLGGDLDLNSSNITGTGNITNVGITTSTTLKATADTNQLVLDSDSSNTTTITAVSTAARVLTLPDATDTLVGKATTDTFTNKTFDANGTGNSLSNVDIADLANGTDGELITWDAAGAPAAVAVGTASHVLTSGGTGVAPTFAVIPTATQAQQETGTSTTEFVTPGRQQYHPGSAKAWVQFSGSSTLDASYNIASITDNSTGNFSINIATDFSSANYAVGHHVGSDTTGAHTLRGCETAAAPTAGVYQVLTSFIDADGLVNVLDLPTNGLTFYGDQ